MSGYGKRVHSWQNDKNKWCIDDVDEVRDVSTARELAAELLAWADAHDTVTVEMPLRTAKFHASLVCAPDSLADELRRYCRKALGVEP